LKKIIKEIFFNNIGLTCNFAELIIIYATSEAPAIIAAIHPTFNAKNHRANLDRLTLVEYSIDNSNETFAIDDLGNRDSVIIRDGNNVDYASDNARRQ